MNFYTIVYSGRCLHVHGTHNMKYSFYLGLNSFKILGSFPVKQYKLAQDAVWNVCTFFSRGKLFLAIIPWANSFSNSWVLFCALKLLSFFFFSFRFFSLYFFLFGPSKMMAPKSPSMWIAVATIANTRKSTIFQTTSFETGRSRRAFAS